MSDILERDSLTTDILKKLSYQSKLGINLKKNLHYFNKEKLIKELIEVNEWYDSAEGLDDLALDYRIKSVQSAILKYKRYYPDHQARKVFDDLLGFRSLCDNYEEVLQLKKIDKFRIADMTNGMMMAIGGFMCIFSLMENTILLKSSIIHIMTDSLIIGFINMCIRKNMIIL